MSEKYLGEKERKQVAQIYGQRGKVRSSICICPKCSHTVPRIRGQKCSKCPICGTQMMRG